MTLAVIVNIWKTNYASLFLSLSILDKSRSHEFSSTSDRK